MANWGKLGSRGNVVDRRGVTTAIGGVSLTGVLVLLLLNYALGGDPGDVLGQLDTIPVEQQQVINKEAFEGADEYEVFASTVLGSNNTMWESLFNKANRLYSPPTLVLFRTGTESACGTATSEVGPHYCPIDKTIYLDETFFDELTKRFGAKGGDVAEAYVISHEVAHHAQNLLGLLSQDPVSSELQADCFAGLWANSIKDYGVFEPGEIHEAMDAAAAVGDDRIQEKVTGYINPETWTHGSSAQRVEWFNKGYNEGNLAACAAE